MQNVIKRLNETKLKDYYIRYADFNKNFKLVHKENLFVNLED